MYQGQYIHDLNPEVILNILKDDVWITNNQTITSAITNDNDSPLPEFNQIAQGENTEGINAYYDIKFDSNVKKILDVGGGKYDTNKNYLKREMNIDLLIWDPYNRPLSHNISIQKEVDKEKLDAATSMSVLNVISEINVRLAHINTLKAALKINGKAYFKIWPGKGLLRGSCISTVTNSSYQANAFANHFLREIEIVFGRGNVKIDKTIPNLIIATKTTESHTSLHNTIQIQKDSKVELKLITKARENSVNRIFYNYNVKKLFSTNLSFFKMLEHLYIKQSGDNVTQLNDKYDKNHSLVSYKY